jgi:hypothetical protein
VDDPSDELPLSTTIPTSLQFEYDTSGIVSIAICESGKPIREYIIADGEPSAPARNSMLVKEILALAKIELNRHSLPMWNCKAAMGAYELARVAKDLVRTMSQYEDKTCNSMMGNLMHKWMDAFVTETDGNQGDGQFLQALLSRLTKLESPPPPQSFKREVELILGPDHADNVADTIKISNAREAMKNILASCLLKSLFGLSYVGIEVKNSDLLVFQFDYFDNIISGLFGIIPAYKLPVPNLQSFSRCCSVVQNGGYALMPRILADDKIGYVDCSPFVMIPGRLARNKVPVDGFFYDEHYSGENTEDLRPNAPVPSDAAASHDIDYVYEEAEYGYKFWTVEAGYRVDLNWLIAGFLNMHVVNDFYDDHADLAYWQLAAPHHIPQVRYPRLVYLTYGNVAARRLALSRAGEGPCVAVVHNGKDHTRALAYAERYNCWIVIL